MSSLRDFQTLKTPKEFGYFYNHSRKKHVQSMVAFYKKGDTKRVGFTASKKIGNAVKRNFAKRRLRAAFLDLQPHLNQGYYIFVAKKEILTQEFTKVQRDMHFALEKLNAIKK